MLCMKWKWLWLKVKYFLSSPRDYLMHPWKRCWKWQVIILPRWRSQIMRNIGLPFLPYCTHLDKVSVLILNLYYACVVWAASMTGFGLSIHNGLSSPSVKCRIDSVSALKLPYRVLSGCCALEVYLLIYLSHFPSLHSPLLLFFLTFCQGKLGHSIFRRYFVSEVFFSVWGFKLE